MTSHATRIIQYYDQCEIDYRLIWNMGRSMALHYGFWTEQVRNLTEAHLVQNEILAESIAIQPNDRVLDAGCGVGGSSIYLSKTRGCQTTGISLSEKQIERARANASRAGLDQLTHFACQDFTATDFADASFSVVWAIESVCHAHNKNDFIKEAWRLLKPGGRLMVADGFYARPSEEYAQAETKLMQGWLHPWAVHELTEQQTFRLHLQNAGFQNITGLDTTNLVRPSSRILYNRARLAYVPAYLMYWLGVRNRLQHNNFLAGLYQWQSLQQGLWHYYVFTAEKPAA